MIAERGRTFRFSDRLRRGPADTRDADHVAGAHLFRGQRQHRREQAGRANCELCSVDADREAAGARVQVITSQRSLAALIEFAFRRQGQGMRRNYDSVLEGFAPIHC